MEYQEKKVQADLLKQNLGNPGNPTNPNRKSPLSPPSPNGGPRFDLTDKDGWGGRSRGWLNRYGSSVILPIIALLILAGGIYLYASQKNQEEALLPSQSEEEMIAGLEEITGLEEELTGQEEITSPAEGIEEEIIEEIIPEGRKEGGEIIEKAVKGDGVTNLARRALKDYLKDNPQELTEEHKIYVEDYLKDSIGSRPLEVDEEITFSEDLVKEAIDASLELTPEQLKILEKYSVLVVWD